MFIAPLFIIARTWKQPRCPSTEEWINKMWYIYTMEYYSADKNIDIMRFAGKWMDLEKIILCEVTQTQKDKHVCLFFLELGRTLPHLHLRCYPHFSKHPLQLHFLGEDCLCLLEHLNYSLLLLSEEYIFSTTLYSGLQRRLQDCRQGSTGWSQVEKSKGDRKKKGRGGGDTIRPSREQHVMAHRTSVNLLQYENRRAQESSGCPKQQS
ncbi:uncharacterized protein LOC143272869 [Peromyscus maniculatus bairdii]|uniref:uncharacterized protein LOC143272869 n=1 Tax=Peromyscus maniculatus bairdii TaxID=230844 RepID=UPI003FD04EA1